VRIVKKDGLPTVRLNGEVAAHIFAGGQYALSCSAFIVDIPPKLGPPRHTHPYEEVFVIVEGTVRLEVDGELLDATPNEICIVPAGVGHTFTNLGPSRARLVNIHAAGEVITDFVDDDSSSQGSYEYNHPGQPDHGPNRTATAGPGNAAVVDRDGPGRTTELPAQEV
jgi:mannose-6-phosphate isomerase-like protein (cupin superfamily)